MCWRVNEYHLRSLVLLESRRSPIYMFEKSCHRQSSIVNCQPNPMFSSVKHGNPSDRGFEDNTRINRTIERSRVNGFGYIGRMSLTRRKSLTIGYDGRRSQTLPSPINRYSQPISSQESIQWVIPMVLVLFGCVSLWFSDISDNGFGVIRSCLVMVL